MSRDMMPSFELYQPDTIEGAAKLAKDVENSWLLAGGQDSYDWFKDYAERGRVFKEEVATLRDRVERTR